MVPYIFVGTIFSSKNYFRDASPPSDHTLYTLTPTYQRFISVVVGWSAITAKTCTVHVKISCYMVTRQMTIILDINLLSTAHQCLLNMHLTLAVHQHRFYR